ncbi:MAG: hypothetical protein GF349_04350 [Candidatus Magasanikbacteria bacterium]|nr:hypothetical protein [Candidatus Magasanikbacteria bacterium]
MVEQQEKTIKCACGVIWPRERFKKDSLEDCPHCNPNEWGLAIGLGSGVKPIGFTDILTMENIGPENRNYDILVPLRDGEEWVSIHKLVERAIEMGANLGEDDGRYLLDNYLLDNYLLDNNFLRDGEEWVSIHKLVERAIEMGANLGEDDGQYLLDNQQDIPASLRGEMAFVFPDWRNPDNPKRTHCISWFAGEWVRGWGYLGWFNWDAGARLLRRK